MSETDKIAENDLRYLRQVLEERPRGLRSGGLIYASAGFLFGAHCLIAAMRYGGLTGASSLPVVASLVFAIGAFVTILCILLWQDRDHPHGKGVASRAVSAAFAGAGIANVALVVVFMVLTIRRQDYSLWLLHPIFLAALQGVAWYAMAVIQRSFKIGLIAAGWFGSAVLLGFVMSNLLTYLLLLSLSLIFLMGVPGLVLMRMARNDSDAT